MKFFYDNNMVFIRRLIVIILVAIIIILLITGRYNFRRTHYYGSYETMIKTSLIL